MFISTCFSKVIRYGPIKKSFLSHLGYVTARNSSLWEPDYLILGHTKPKEYDLINVQIKGFDYVILEKYQSVIHKLAKKMNLNVPSTWASPQQDLQITRYKPNSTTEDATYNLKKYERNVQVLDVKAYEMQIFIELIVTACPPGVKVSIHEHQPDLEEVRYIPDFELLNLQKTLAELNVPIKKKGK